MPRDGSMILSDVRGPKLGGARRRETDGAAGDTAEGEGSRHL
jgi:hypothetical protein